MSEVVPPPRRFGDIARELKRDTLLDAATSLLGGKSWREISMEAVALRAGVSRQTIYNEFGSRSGFEHAYVLREVARFLDGFEQAVTDDNAGSVTETLEAGMRNLLAGTRASEMARAITRGEADELLALFTTRGRPIVTAATERVAEFAGRQWPWLDPATATGLADSLVRLAISHGALAMDNDANTARSVAAITGAFIEIEHARSGWPAAGSRASA